MKYLSLFLIIILLSVGYVKAQCPVVSPNDFGSVDGGSPGCDAGTWKKEQSAAFASSTCVDLTGANSFGGAWYCTTYSLTCDFCVTFNFSLPAQSATDTSDGIAFIIQDQTAPGGAAISSGTGGNLGYDASGSLNSSSLVFEIDVYDNSPDDNDLACDHITMIEDGDNDTAPIEQACAPSNLNDGGTHTFSLCWDPTAGANGELTVSIDGTDVFTYTGDITSFFGGTDVWFGLTSGAGPDLAGDNQVCDFDVTPISSMGIDVQYFELSQRNNAVVINWSAVEDEKFDAYIVERSSDLHEWTLVKELVPTQRESGKDNSYQIVDRNAEAGMHYYRLSESDVDGALHQHITKKINVEKEDVDIHSVTYSDGQLSASLSYAHYENSSFAVYDLVGSLLVEIHPHSDQWAHGIHLNTGAYIAVFRNGEKTVSRRFVVN